MELRLYNTLSRKTDIFLPIDANNIKMYVCGPTVYDRAHIGNARPAVVFDVLYRMLKTMYPNVTYVRNITDVDDKIYKRATEKNVSIAALTEQTIEMYHADMSALNVLPPTIEPCATHHIQEIIDFIQSLLNNGFAYIADNHVYFDVSMFKDYGKLSNKNINELISGARISVSKHKRNQLDFVLWKPKDSNFDVGWDSPFGVGRPGWHIECSAMSKKYLGDVFDIHGGGIDLVFPHHENEIAQSCALSGKQNMANYWLHNGHVTVNGTKMSKSAGNFVTINELLNKYDGESIRLSLLMTQYSSPLNFSESLLQQAKNILEKWKKLAVFEECDTISASVFESLSNNLNTPQAIAEMHNVFKNNPKVATNTAQKLLGILTQIKEARVDETWINKMIQKRNTAKANKDYATADSIRTELAQNNIIIDDTPNGTAWKIK